MKALVLCTCKKECKHQGVAILIETIDKIRNEAIDKAFQEVSERIGQMEQDMQTIVTKNAELREKAKTQ